MSFEIIIDFRIKSLYNCIMKVCLKCFNELDEMQFNYRNKKKNKLSPYCKICTRTLIKDHYVKNRAYYINKAKKRNKMYLLELKKFISNYLLTHPCKDCSESDIIVLEFDHLYQKKFNISDAVGMKYSITRVKEEIKKCEVVCSNCHRRRTAKRLAELKTMPR